MNSVCSGFMKPILSPHTNLSSVNELLLLIKELGNLKHINVIFIFSEKEALITKLLVKYKIATEISRISDPGFIYFDMFQIKNLYQKSCECKQRNTHIFSFNGDQAVEYIEYGRNVP
jgi:hypothetical protein